MSSIKTEEVTEKTVKCDGGLSGHPCVYLSIDKTGKVICPYCSKCYILVSANK